MAKYYEFKNDIESNPECIIFVIWSMRGSGKTYSTLRWCIENNKKVLYLKRTIEDVKFISGYDKTGNDVSPFAPLNRDFGWNLHINPVRGKQGFCTVDTEDGKNVGYVLAISAVHKVKGFEMSDTDIIVYDEFLPQLSELRINHNEGDILLDLHATVSRDRIARGEDEIPIVLLANATNPVSPVTETLKLTDTIIEMSNSGTEKYVMSDRGIFLHNIKESPSMPKSSKFYNAVRDTKWALMAYDNQFSYADFSKVKRMNLKGSICHAEILYNRERWYLYQNPKGVYIMTRSRSTSPTNSYNFDIDGDRTRLWYDFIRDVQEAVVFDEAVFESYSMYYMTMNYQKLI